MKRLIFLELTFLFLATTFSSNPPPGWVQQTLPVNDFVRDIFFLDSLDGWVATVSYILKTTNGGDNWAVTDSSNNSYYKIQFFDNNTGYRCGVLGGGGASVWKTTNSGYNWGLKYNFGFGFGIEDLQFLDENTGWISSSDFDFGGIWKTTNGGNSWIRQLSPTSFPLLKIKAISILNNDTGWAINDGTFKELYRTTNGGTNWNTQYSFGGQLNDISFLNKDTGIISGGINFITTNGGFNWIQTNDGGIKLSFGNDSIGWAGDVVIQQIHKTSNSGITWYRQTTDANNPIPFALSTLNAWAGGNKLLHTTDGGGLSSVSVNNIFLNSFVLNQNYPNPFNPITIINYQLRNNSFVTLKVFEINGKEIKTLISQRQNAGNYEIYFDGSSLNSGVYFYRIEVLDEKGIKIQNETKKMLLVR